MTDTPANAAGEPSPEDAALPQPAEYDPSTGEQLTPPDVVEEPAEEAEAAPTTAPAEEAPPEADND